MLDNSRIFYFIFFTVYAFSFSGLGQNKRFVSGILMQSRYFFAPKLVFLLYPARVPPTLKELYVSASRIHFRRGNMLTGAGRCDRTAKLYKWIKEPLYGRVEDARGIRAEDRTGMDERRLHVGRILGALIPSSVVMIVPIM